MDGATEQATVIPLPVEETGLKDFWAVYDAHYDEITNGILRVLADHPDMGPVIRAMPAEQMAEQNRRSRELTRQAILHRDWTPYLADLRAQGAAYAKGGLRFSAWFSAVGAFRAQLTPYLLEAYGKMPQRLLSAMDGVTRFIDSAMAVIGEEYLRTKEQTILQQQEALRELSTPVLQVRDRMLLLPIMGVVDTLRARQLTEDLLRAIRANRARMVVIDITGVPAVDSKVANHLVQTVDAARLMGATAIVSGLSAEVAQSLVTLGVDLRMLNTVGDLQGGLEEAERRLGYRVRSLAQADGHLEPSANGERARQG